MDEVSRLALDHVVAVWNRHGYNYHLKWNAYLVEKLDQLACIDEVGLSLCTNQISQLVWPSTEVCVLALTLN